MNKKLLRVYFAVGLLVFLSIIVGSFLDEEHLVTKSEVLGWIVGLLDVGFAVMFLYELYHTFFRGGKK